MDAKVILKFTKGSLANQEFDYERKKSITLGRDKSCTISLPETYTGVSHKHCRLDVDPPYIVVTDLGSSNGTYLNGVKIDPEEAALSGDEAKEQLFEKRFMKSGDRLNLGKNCEIVVNIVMPQYVENIVQEAADLKKTADKPKRYNPRCKLCGAILPGEITTPGYCLKCLHDSGKMLKMLVKEPNKMEEDDSDTFDVIDYRRIHHLGSGGMGIVWLVEEMTTGSRMALKMIQPEKASTERERNLFLREAFNGEQLEHDNVVGQYQLGYSNEAIYILMEYCEGGSVEDLITRNRKIFWDEKTLSERIDIATPILLQVLDGLHYIHQVPVTVKLGDGSLRQVHGLVHRDIKPGNILLSDESLHPVAKIADLGISKAYRTAGLTGPNGTPPHEFRGDLRFVARQQIRDYLHAKPEVDVWAAAAGYYYMLTGFPPKNIITGNEVDVATSTKAIPIRKRVPDIPPRLAKVMDKALIDDPEIGIQSAMELKNEIKNALSL